MFKIRDAPDNNFAGYPENSIAGYRISRRIFDLTTPGILYVW
jgi:hypothetical protein